MMKFAFVEDGVVQQVTDALPQTWRNVSNFFALEDGDEEYLNSIGWYRIIKDAEFSYNPNTQQLLPPRFEFVDGKVYQRDEALDAPPPIDASALETPMHAIRQRRGVMMDMMRWRYERYDRHVRLGLDQIDTLEDMDKYMQALANITDVSNPSDIVWPVYPPTNDE